VTVRILIGDVREVLRTLPDESVDCCISSPPYWGLRSYLPADHPQKHLEIGSEPTVQEWVRTMVEVFGEVRRVLKPEGTLWLNLGDSYAGARPTQGVTPPSSSSTLRGNGHTGGGPKAQRMVASRRRDNHAVPRSDVRQDGLKPKDMAGQPWRVAFALQDAGWWLRQEIIWAKRSPMPESVRDRFTKSHEHVFLLAKSQTYYFDFDAIQEPASMGTHERSASTGVGFGHGFDDVQKPRVTPKAALATSGNDGAYADGKSERMGRGAGWRSQPVVSDARKALRSDIESRHRSSVVGGQDLRADPKATRNPRSVRWLSSEPFRGAHFATFPAELIRPFVLAGCPHGGTVLDPFGGSGTTGLVADQEGRNAILIDLDERNGPMAENRIAGAAPLLAQVVRE
jgi:DNA modification methylase